MTPGESRYGSFSYGTQPYAGELRTEIRLRATLAGTSSLTVSALRSKNLTADLAGTGAMGVYVSAPVHITQPPGLVIRSGVGFSRVGVRR